MPADAVRIKTMDVLTYDRTDGIRKVELKFQDEGFTPQLGTEITVVVSKVFYETVVE